MSLCHAIWFNYSREQTLSSETN